MSPSENVSTKPTILIAEDEPLLRTILLQFLERTEHPIITCENGLEALEQYKIHQKDIGLCLLDIRMPLLNGWDCLNGIRQINSDAVVYFLSGDFQLSPQENQQEEPNGFLQKPFRLKMLMEIIDNVFPQDS